MTTNSTGGNSRMTDEALDPFDLASLRLDQTYSDGVAVKKLITMIRVGKPQKQHFVRVNPDPGYRISPVAIIDLKDDREATWCRRHWLRNSLASSYRSRSSPP